MGNKIFKLLKIQIIEITWIHTINDDTQLIFSPSWKIINYFRDNMNTIYEWFLNLQEDKINTCDMASAKYLSNTVLHKTDL